MEMELDEIIARFKELQEDTRIFLNESYQELLKKDMLPEKQRLNQVLAGAGIELKQFRELMEEKK